MRRLALLAALAFVGSCERPTTITSPSVSEGRALDTGCWLMAIEGSAPRTALIRLVTAGHPLAPRLVVSPNSRSSDTALEGMWRYGPTTDSMYVSLGSVSDGGYGMWLQRINTSAADSLAWIGGVRAYVKEGEAWTGTVRLTRASCRD